MTRQVTIVNRLGLHARSAAQIARLVEGAKADIWLDKDGDSADAASIIDMLALACAQGSRVIVRIEDRADQQLLEAIVRLIEEGFGE